VEPEPAPPPVSSMIVQAIPRARSVTLVMHDRPHHRRVRPLTQPIVRPPAPAPVARTRRPRWPVAAAVGLVLTAAIGCFVAARTSSDHGLRRAHVTHAAQR
jgi:hypothetical protein